MKKKWIALCLAVICLTVAGCSGKPSEAAPVIQPETIKQQLDALAGGDAPLFGALEQPGADQLKEIYGIDSTLCAEYLICFGDDYSFFVMARPAEGKENDLKNNLAQSIDNYAAQLELYSPEGYARVKNRLETLRGDALIYVASSDNTAVMDALDAALGW